MQRQDLFTNHSIHHIYNRSIAKYRIFGSDAECQRMLLLTAYYQFIGQRSPFSDFIRLWSTQQSDMHTAINTAAQTGRWTKVVDLIAWCLIPNHYHFVLKQLHDGGIDLCMRRSLDGFTRYLNLRRNRRGPLWESRLKNTKIQDRKHLATAIEYVHRNPVKHRLCRQEKQWVYSSIHGFDHNLIEVIEFK